MDEKQKSKVSSIADMFKHVYHCSSVEIILFSKYLALINFFLANFINMIMKFGKNTNAENIVYQSQDTVINSLGQKADTTPQVFQDILDKVKPVVEVRSRRVGGATYQIPVEVRQERREALAMRWLIESAR